ncbi:MAG: DNA gyrase C-terminal beta-propeller domain-containing protein, partial [Pseudoclavibacter sp.]
YAGLTERDERVIGLVPVDGAEPIALVTAMGVVKRVALGDFGKLAEAEIIALKQGDEIVTAAVGRDDDEFVLVSDDAQLLHFSATVVRPQGRPAAGMAGIKLGDGARVIAARILSPAETSHAAVVTVASSSSALPGTDTGSAKVS